MDISAGLSQGFKQLQKVWSICIWSSASTESMVKDWRRSRVSGPCIIMLSDEINRSSWWWISGSDIDDWRRYWSFISNSDTFPATLNSQLLIATSFEICSVTGDTKSVAELISVAVECGWLGLIPRMYVDRSLCASGKPMATTLLTSYSFASG